ncbi:Ankyrin repeat protein 2 [Giardia muris]|uniref:Ankyrin repeat protein 2 n=1 Tax=Giardia muris TaxID=5742 RepID=A0A4Z1SQV3_GIAMU|nr:Ankyrin repeat protein 2 [Giardia muris]|eukprot:TNJ28254.1 Ankyrin repeat protein 2 [Giardia muris]
MSVTALVNAAKKGDLEGVKRNLSQAGKKDEDGRTALMYATIWGHADCIPLLEKEIGMQNNCGRTALMLAASDGYTDCVRLLLSEVGSQSTRGWRGFPPGTTALMIAAHENYPEVVKLLLPHEQGLKDSKGHSAQWHANNSSWGGNFTRVRKLLKNEGSKRAPPPPKESVFLHICTVAGDVEGVRKYVSHAGYQDSNGMTALMLAAEKGYAECILLLEEEAGMQDKGGWTALMHAAYNGHSNCIPLLKEEVEKKNNSGQTALMKAAECGQTKCIPLLEKEIGKQDSSGWTALMFAAFYGKTDCIRHLLSEAGKQTTKEWTDFFNAYPPGTTALMMAVYYNHPEVVELLLPYEQGLKDSKGHNAQWHANNGVSWGGDFTRVNELLENEGTERIPPPPNGLLLFLRSVMTGDVEGVRKNLSHSGYQDSTGTTALMHAASEGHTACVRLLLSEAGKQTTEERYGFPPGTTALMMAARRNHPDIVELLLPYEQGLEDSKGHNAQWHANSSARGGDFTRVNELLENEGTKRAPPPPKESILLHIYVTAGDIKGVRKYVSYTGYQDLNGMTALMLAARNGRTGFIPLLEKEIGMQDNWGGTALMWAAYYGKTDSVRLLLCEAGKQSTKEFKITLNGKTVTFLPGTTALMLAAYFNYPEVVELLLPCEQGLKDSEGHTANWYANNSSWGGDFARVRELLENEGTIRLPPPPKEALMLLASAMTGDVEGVRRNLSHTRYQDPTGKTALMLAAEKGRVNCIPLLEREIEMRNNDGWTALMLAAYNGNADCVKVLLSEAGKQTTSKLGSFFPGTTALMIAARRNHPEVVKLLLPYEQGLRDSKGRTAKWYADNSSEEKDFSQVRQLLKNEDTNRLSPPPKEALILSFFAMKGDVEGVRKYVSHAGYQDSNGMTALMKAAMVGHSNCISILEREIGMRDNDGRTALMLVASNGKMDCAQILLPEAGKQTTKEWDSFPSGMTALMIAAYFNHPDVVKLLLPYEQGMRNSEEHAAKWYAYNGKALRGHYSQIHELLEYEGLERIPPPTPGAANRRGVRELSSSRSLPEGMTCVICLTNPKDTLLQPCNHICVCSTCAEQTRNGRCPLCRTPVESTVKVYL